MSDQAKKLLAQQKADPSWPKAGETWQHFRGGLYDVVAMAVHEKRLTHLVVYRSRLYGYVWARDLNVWLERVYLEPWWRRLWLFFTGRYAHKMPRFTKIGVKP